MNTTHEFIAMLRARDVQIWADQDELSVDAPDGSLTQTDVEELRHRKQELLTYLRSATVDQAEVPKRVRDPKQPLPMSSQQKRLWFLEQLRGPSPAYNIAGTVHITGNLGVTCLQEAFRLMAHRHEILRTRFTEVDGEPMQLVADDAADFFAHHDISTMQSADQDGDLALHSARELATSFDLSSGPLIKATLVTLAVNRRVLLLVMHHIVADGWSMGIVLQELVQLYRQLRMDQHDASSELPLQYADYSRWQQEWLESLPAQQLRRNWREKMSSAQPLKIRERLVTLVPATSNTGALHKFVLSSELCLGIRAVASASGATVFMTLLSLYQLLLARITGQDDITVASPVAGRDREEFGSLIGLFANTVLFRAHIQAKGDFHDHLQAVRRECLDVYAHQALPFDNLVADLHAVKQGLGTSLARVGFAVQASTGANELHCDGIRFKVEALKAEATKNDLTLTLIEEGDHFVGVLEYSSALFGSEEIVAIADRFVEIAGAVVVDSRVSVATLIQDADSDTQQSTTEANHSQNAVQSHFHSVNPNRTDRQLGAVRTMHDLVQSACRRYPSRIAISAHGKQISYAELDGFSNRLANFLRSQGVGRNDIVALCFRRSTEMVASMLGVLKAGAAYLPLDPTSPAQRLHEIVADAKPKLVLTHRDLLPVWEAVSVQAVSMSEQNVAIDCHTDTYPGSVSEPGDLAYVIYTSGSTGRPKGVMVTHANVTNHNLFCCEEFGLTEFDRIVQFASYCFDASVEEIFPTLMSGAMLILRDEIVPSVEAFNRQLIEGSVTVLNLPTAYWHTWCLSVDEVFVRSTALRLVIVGGERVSAESVRPWLKVTENRIRWVNTYGPTETTVTCTWHRLEGTVPDDIPIGRPIWNTSIHILDERCAPVPIGTPGEIYIGGEGVARGYLNNKILTAERFVPDPFRGGANDRMYKTGDLARFAEDGTIYYIGRKDDQIKVRGHRLEIGEVEFHLRRLPGIREAAVIPSLDESGSTQLLAYITCIENTIDEQGVRKQLRAALPEFMVPTVVTVLTNLPLTRNGKIDRSALAALAVNNSAPTRTESNGPTSSTERAIAEIWKELLRAQHVNRDENFFDIGGHSLLAVRVASRVSKALRKDVHVKDIFSNPTIEKLATYLDAQSKDVDPILRVDRASRTPLSAAQQRLWVIEKVNGGGHAYHIAGALRIDGELAYSALQKSVQVVATRHEILRTQFIDQGGVAAQQVLPLGEIDLVVGDLSSEQALQNEAALREHVQSLTKQPFNLDKGPLFRVHVIRTSQKQHLLVIVMHHIIADGWSIEILVRELIAHYEAAQRGVPAALPDLPVQYIDYATWQRRWMEGEIASREIAYWKSELAETPSHLKLPTDRPRPDVQSFRGASASFNLGNELSLLVRNCAKSTALTPYMVLCSAVAVLLHRLSGQHEVVIGIPVANRDRPEVEGLIGFFVNTIPVRLRFEQDTTVTGLLNQVRDVFVRGYQHSRVPFDKIVEAVAPARSLNRGPLFQVLATLQAEQTYSRVGGLDISHLAIPASTAQFDLTFSFVESESDIGTVVSYATDLFDRSTIEQWGSCLLVILEDMLTRREIPLGSVAMLKSADRELYLSQIAEELGQRKLVSVSEHNSLQRMFESQVGRTPDAPAVVCGGVSLSYGELNCRANRLARLLISDEAYRDTARVALCIQRSIDAVVGVIAILKTGRAYVPIDPDAPAARVTYTLADSECAYLLTDSHTLKGLTSQGGIAKADAVRILLLDDDETQLRLSMQSNGNLVESSSTAEDPAYVIYTSGSTGTPKGCVVSHRNVLRLFSTSQRHFQFTNRDVWTLFHSLAFDFSVWEMWGSLLHGGKLIVVPYWITRSAEEFRALLAAEGVTVLNQTPSAFLQLAAVESEYREQDALNQLRYVIFGGEALDFRSLKGWVAQHGAEHPRLVNMYGITETTVHVTYRPIMLDDVDSGMSSIGQPLDDLSVLVLDQAGEPVPNGIVGEMYVAGAGVSLGYLGRPELTRERFVQPAWGLREAIRLYRTGDLARRQTNGGLEYVGRADSQVKIRGFRIEIGEIEHCLSGVESIAAVAVVLKESLASEQRLVAYLVPTAKEICGNSELEANLGALAREHLRTRLPEYMVPAYFVVLSALPVTENGKLNRKALPTPHVASAQGASYVAASTATERVLERVWLEVLGIDRVSALDNFFDLGGDSILAIQVVARARNAGLQLTPRALFEHPTIQTVAKHCLLADRSATSQDPIEGPVTLLPIQHWFLSKQSGAAIHHFNFASLVSCPFDLTPEQCHSVVQALMHRHDILRLRLSNQNGHWRADHLSLTDAMVRQSYQMVDCAAMNADDRQDAIHAHSRAVQQHLNIQAGPLFKIVHYRGGSAHTPLALVVAHHMVVDGVSWRILMEDIATIVQQLARGTPIKLGAKTHSYQSWAAALEHHGRAGKFAKEKEYWCDILSRASALPVDTARSDDRAAVVSRVTVALTREETELLLTHSASAFKTRINDLLLSALALCVRDWTGRSSIVIDLEGHGREDLFEEIDLTQTVGWFTTKFPVCLEVPQCSTEIECIEATIKAVKEALRNIPSKGVGYGVLRYLCADAEIVALDAQTALPISFNYLGQWENEEGGLRLQDGLTGLSSSDIRSSYKLDINGMAVDGILRFNLLYNTTEYSRATIEQFGVAFTSWLQRIAQTCQRPIGPVLTPSDFPLAQITQAALAELEMTHRHIEDLYPATPMQRGLLYATFSQEKPHAYCVQYRFRLQHVSTALWRNALETLVSRHAILRTTFELSEDHGFMQVVHPTIDLPWRQVSLVQTPRDLWEPLVAQELRQELEYGFELEAAAYFRCVLIELDQNISEFVFTFHHAILDGWSGSILFSELQGIYDCLVRAATAALPAPAPFRAYVEWLQNKDLLEAKRYWADRLADIVRVQPRVSTEIHAATPARVSLHKHVLSESNTRELTEAAGRFGVTLNTIIQAAWVALLAIESAASRVVFGVTTSGRDPSIVGIERVVGPMICTVPIVADWRVDQLLPPWLKALSLQQVEANAHGYVGLSEIQRSIALTPNDLVFESLLVFENYPIEKRIEDASEWKMEAVGAIDETHYPVTLLLVPGSKLYIQIASLETYCSSEAGRALLDRYIDTLSRFGKLDRFARLGDVAPARVPGPSRCPVTAELA